MKRKLVLIALFILPLSAYVYFSMAKHNSLFLPVLTEKVNELPKSKSLDGKPVQLTGKLTVLGFLGKDVIAKKEAIFNINQKINSKYKEFKDFQIVMLLPEGGQEDVERIASELKVMADISNWRFVFAKPEEIAAFYETMKVREPLGADQGTYNLFIIDKERRLRGRNGENEKTGKNEYKDSYNSFSAAELHNEMTDDIKIVLREYRLALKKNSDLKGVKREI